MKIRHLIIAIFCILFFGAAWAEESSIVLTQAPIDPNDVESIKRGAKFFSTNCMSCHTLVYLRYDKLAKEAGITLEKMPLNVKDWPNGIKPPDLSLETEIRGVDWIYTYLHSFYQDAKRPTGANNLLVPGTAMPNILGAYQGLQVKVEHPNTGAIFERIHWFDELKLMQQGTMSPEQFDAVTSDVVNFLGYAAEPYRAEQHRLGWWVLGFLAVFFVFMYALKKEFWKDIKKQKRE